MFCLLAPQNPELTGLGLSTKSCVVIHEEVISILGFDDDEHLEEWISENPQWCDVVKGSEVFNECEPQCFVTAGVSTYQELIDGRLLKCIAI
jgi:hypothetical protein